MDFWQFMKLYGALAALAGVGFALIKQMFSFVWRLSKVEEQGARHEDILDGLKTPIDKMGRSISRIEAKLEDLDRRRRND